MPKLLLTLFFTCIFCFDVFAENGPKTSIVELSVPVEISLSDAAGWVESPSIMIRNSTDHCSVDANQLGQADLLLNTLFDGPDQKKRSVQITSALFGNCRIYFGRIRAIGSHQKSQPAVLLGVQSHDEKTFEVRYDGKTSDEQMIKLSEEMLAKAGLSSNASSNSDAALVLLSR